MLRLSFRSLAAGVLPPKTAHKQTLAAAAILAVAGCGGGTSEARTATLSGNVEGAVFTFEAPAGWKVARTPRSVAASSGADLLSVTVFPLARPYRPQLFTEVANELDRRVADLAGELRGELRSTGTGHIAGRRARVYEIGVGDRVERLLYVFRGKLEFQLLCRFARGRGTGPCDRLAETFTLT
jgi:hypothetical protein